MGVSCETSNSLLTISFYNACWQCNIRWGLLASSDTPLERKKQVQIFTSIWVPYRAPRQFILKFP